MCAVAGKAVYGFFASLRMTNLGLLLFSPFVAELAVAESLHGIDARRALRREQ